MLDLQKPLRWNLKPVRLLCTNSTARPGLPCVGLAKWPDGVETLLEFSKDGIRVHPDLNLDHCSGQYRGPDPRCPVTNPRLQVIFTDSGEVRAPRIGEWFSVNGAFVQCIITSMSFSRPIFLRTERYED